MKRLVLLLALLTSALSPALAQTVADTGEPNPLPYSGLSTCFLSATPESCAYSLGRRVMSLPVATTELTSHFAKPNAWSGVQTFVNESVKTYGALAYVDLGTRQAALGFLPIDFKAKCDGSTDDNVALQALINAAANVSAQAILVPRGRTCVTSVSLHIPSNTKLIIDGVLKTLGAAGGALEIVPNADGIDITGHGVIDNGWPLGTTPSASAPSSCIDSHAVTNLSVTGLTLQNCGNWPWNIAAYTATPGGGSKNVYFSYVSALGAGNRNSAEFADGCDNCWADHVLVDSLAVDQCFAFYGNITNSGITNSRMNNCGAFGIAVLSDGTLPAANSVASSDILIQGNEISNSGSAAILVLNNASSGAVNHSGIRIIGNNGHNNNTLLATSSAAANQGGEVIGQCDGCFSSGNVFHDDGGSTTINRPVAGILLYPQAVRFTSVGDTVYNEGSKGQIGIGAVLSSGIVAPSFTSFRVYDNQSTTSMRQAFNGHCGSDCSIVGTRVSSIPNAWAGMTFNGSNLLANDGLGNSISGDLYENGIITAGAAFLGARAIIKSYNEKLSSPTQGSACAAGDFTDDKSAHYICSAINTWVASPTSPTLTPGLNASTTAPTLSCGSGTLTSGSAALRTKAIGKLIFFNLKVTITTAGSCASGVYVNGLPFTAVNAGAASNTYGYERGVTGLLLQFSILPNNNYGVFSVLTSNQTTQPITPANGYLLESNGWYEAQ